MDCCLFCICWLGIGYGGYEMLAYVVHRFMRCLLTVNAL
jgi:hypothetical protein